MSCQAPGPHPVNRVGRLLTIFNAGVTQIEPGFGREAMAEAGPECRRVEAGIHAAAFSGVAPVSAFCGGAGSLCGEMGGACRCRLGGPPVFQLPAYASELSPSESAWAVLKRSLANLVKHNISLTAPAKSRLRRMQYRPGLLEGFLAGTRLDLTPCRNPQN